jgi:glycosyltransferase involved in cell wall biosynthesis
MAQKPRLRIALVAPLVSPIAEPFLGGAQALIHDLALGLAQRGHNVTLFAARGSKFKNGTSSNLELREVAVDNGELKLADFNARSRDGIEGAAADAAFFRQAELFLEVYLEINRSGRFDVAHAHAFDWPSFAYSPLLRIPTVHTVHLPAVDNYINRIIQTTYQKTGTSNCVTVSKTCAAAYQEFFPFDRVIYNAIDTKPIPFENEGEDFLFFAGRMTPEKGVDLAIDIALQSGRRLIMAGGVYDANYFEDEIMPRLAAHPEEVQYLGILRREEVWRWMSRAYCVLFPSRWEEPFGLVMAEAMAAGAPVIAFRKGAAQELIIDGKTGFLVDPENVRQASAAIERAGEINRTACRRHIETNFGFDRMIDEYEDYYYSKL